MKKKLLTLVVLMALVLTPTFAKSSDMSAGLALGTLSGVGFKYNLDKDMTVGGTVGLDFLNGNALSVEAFGLYKASDFKIEKETFDVNVGAGAAANIPLSNTGVFSVSGLVMGEVSYSFDGDIPLDVLLRVEPGVRLTFSGGVAAAVDVRASLQGLWRF